MSVTVEDCLALPSLKDAMVVGGSKGLNKIIASVSVLEYANVSLLHADLFSGSEMVLTAFATARDDVKVQCDVMRHLYEQGVVAFVLYYLGIIVPKLDEKVIAVADELSLPLITMPPKNMTYRYSDVISEVAEAILYDTLHEEYFVPSIIERAAQFPENQRTINNVLRMLSDRFHISIIVADEQMCLVSSAFWPRTSALEPDGLIKCIQENMSVIPFDKVTELAYDSASLSTFSSTIRLSGNRKMYVFIIMEEKMPFLKALSKNALMQISESIQLIVSMQNYSDWSRSSNLLINAIMNDDAYKTNQIAMQSGIDVQSIHNMWVLIMAEATKENRSEILTTNWMTKAKNFLLESYKTVFVGSYGENVICLMSDAPDYDESHSAQHDFMDRTGNIGELLLLSFSDLQTRMDARKAYEAAMDGWFTLKIIYQSRSVFDQQDLKFALTCRKIVHQESSVIQEYIAVLNPLMAGGHTDDLMETLAVFLLDTGVSVAMTAKQMHLHPNTIKYRLKEIKQRLNKNITRLPESYELYLACALVRLMKAI